MDKIGHLIGDKYRNIASNFMGVLQNSKFKEEGVLTPEEFVLAGDFLTSKCPTWKWCSSKNESNIKDYLPKEKQYLITTVPCLTRANNYNKESDYKEFQVEEDSWTMTEFKKQTKPEIKEIHDFEELDKKKPVVINEIDNYIGIEGIESVKLDENTNDKDKDEDIEGIEGIEETNDVFIVEVKDEILKSRTYDVSINYDYYYRVPRLWLTGYSESGSPLSDEEVKEDIMLDYIDKTVTIEKHPFTGNKSISIHPCRHSLLIKNMAANYERAGKTLQVDRVILLFLKFISSVVPTIKYDFTLDIDM